jgi:hypothetical protein
MQTHFIEPEPMLQAGAIFDSRVKDWIDSIFEKDLASGTVIVHQERLVLPAGIESYSSAEESRLRNDVYNINALLTSYRMRQLCTLDRVVGGESLLHAHAELFLSKGYAAWNLTGKSRLDFENSLKRLTDPTLTMLFTGNAPVCSVENNEIIDSADLKEQLLQLQRENANFQAISEQAAEDMADLRNKLMQKDEQIQLMEENLGESIQAALSAKEKELESLRNNTDLIVASALQEQKDVRRDQAQKDPARIASLEAYVKTLEKERAQLEHYLRIARDALLQKKYEEKGTRPPPRNDGVLYEPRLSSSSDSDEEYDIEEVPSTGETNNEPSEINEDQAKPAKKRPEKGCIVM